MAEAETYLRSKSDILPVILKQRWYPLTLMWHCISFTAILLGNTSVTRAVFSGSHLKSARILWQLLRGMVTFVPFKSGTLKHSNMLILPLWLYLDFQVDGAMKVGSQRDRSREVSQPSSIDDRPATAYHRPSTTSPVISPSVVTSTCTCTLGIHTYYSANYSSPSTTLQTVHSQPTKPPPSTQQRHITSPQITSVLTRPCTSPNPQVPLFQLIASGQCNTVSPVL